MKWSTLRTIAQSRAAEITILVPIIGFFIVFNQNFIELVRLTPTFAESLAGRASQVGSAANAEVTQVTLGRLYFLYFGLSFVGFASLLFRMGCPDIVKRHSDRLSFHDAEIGRWTPSRARLVMYDLSKVYLSWTSKIPPLLLPKAHERFRFEYVIFTHILKDELEEEGRQGMVLPPSSSKFARMWTRYSPDLEPVRRRVVDRVPNHQLAVFGLEYSAADLSNPLLRSLIAVFFGIGFVLLSIPTVEAFLKVARLALDSLIK
jgi:hypothetical protein